MVATCSCAPDGTETRTDDEAGESTAERADGPVSVTAETELGRQLADRAGRVVTAELERTLRTFDDGNGVSPDARRVVSTMAIRIAVGLLQRPGRAGEDDIAAETVARLFLSED